MLSYKVQNLKEVVSLTTSFSYTRVEYE
jgi:hypothetical protein